MTLSQSEILDKIISISKGYGAKRLILFGGYADNPTEAHDIDIACEGIQGWKLYEFAGRVENEIIIPVDIVSLQPPSDLTRMIEAQGKIIYDSRETA